MTLDGKIATSTGHSAWVSSPASRQQVFETRARSDAVIVGGQTVRLDNPRLTTRREGGHMPMRIVMSRTLDLQEVMPTQTTLQTRKSLRHGCRDLHAMPAILTCPLCWCNWPHKATLKECMQDPRQYPQLLVSVTTTSCQFMLIHFNWTSLAGSRVWWCCAGTTLAWLLSTACSRSVQYAARRLYPQTN